MRSILIIDLKLFTIGIALKIEDSVLRIELRITSSSKFYGGDLV